MRLTIVPEDRLIGIDGIFYHDIQQDLSWIPSNVYAVQWSDSSGEIEYNDGTPNEIISDLGIYAQAQTDFNNEIQRISAAEEAARDYWEELRAKRNQLLADTDYLALVDTTLSADMRTYRQALRDLPANTSDPVNPSWPTPPS
tara:strand:- start:60 stop:488 length:429 start_codon:yes stop_codon:yes gene_type:complete